MPADLILVVEVLPGVEGRNNVYMVNHSKPAVKDWLTRTCVWAVLNGHTVTLRAPTKDDLETRWLFRPRTEARQPEETAA